MMEIAPGFWSGVILGYSVGALVGVFGCTLGAYLNRKGKQW